MAAGGAASAGAGFALAVAADARAPAEYDTRPEPLKSPPPVYPAQFKGSDISGVVAVKMLIDQDGIAIEATPLQLHSFRAPGS